MSGLAGWVFVDGEDGVEGGVLVVVVGLELSAV